MQSLKAVQAREIDKSSVAESEPLNVNGEPVPQSEVLAMQAGDFYFRPNVVKKTAEPPSGCFRRLGWRPHAEGSGQSGSDISQMGDAALIAHLRQFDQPRSQVLLD
jgi:hypothetical protein